MLMSKYHRCITDDTYILSENQKYLNRVYYELMYVYKKKKKIKNTPQFQTSKKVEQIKRDLHQSPDAKMSTVLLVCHASIANF